MAGNFWKSSHYKQWILNKQDLHRQRGEDLKLMGEDDYNKVMIFFTNYIHALATETPLQSRQQMIATATVYFRRFYARRSLKDINPFILSAFCIILAAKVEEHGYSVTMPSKVATAMSNLNKKHPYIPCNPGPEHTKVLNNHNAEVEFYLLEVLDCCLVVYQPYRTLVQLFHEMEDSMKDYTNIVHDAWKIVNDSLCTDACLLYAPHQISIACFMTAGIINQKEEEMRLCFQDLAADYDVVFEIIKMIMQSYKLGKDVVLSPQNADNIKALLAKMPKPSGVSPAGVPLGQPPSAHGMGGASMEFKHHR